MTFHVGQKVVLVDDAAENGYTFIAVRGRWQCGLVYTIRDFVPSHITPDQINVRLCEITRRNDHFGFSQRRFRPIVERKTDISFTQGADPSTDKLDNRRKVRERA